jgi:hypothetical protein
MFGYVTKHKRFEEQKVILDTTEVLLRKFPVENAM